ncbi:MAG: protein kinase domain-containing protein [Terriglobales bacterium]
MGSTKIKTISKYHVLDVLGKGGMGVVYKATDPAIGRLVAIKMITGGLYDDSEFLKRFYREAQSTGKLQHPNIVIVHDLGDEDGAPFLVMEYLEGESVQSIINERRPLPLLDKLNYITQACDGLHYAHQQNIVHRDIKPANLMVLKDGVVKIVDFGVARIGNESVTRTGQVIGTIQYMSPEQINGNPVDCRTDIFSLGVVLYELLTYSLPFQGRDTGSTLLKIINEPPPTLDHSLATYPPELDGILQRALAKTREERYATAEDFAFDLGQVQDQLKRQMISEYLQAAEGLIARSELNKAKDQVFQILKVDRQNRRGNELLKQIQSLMHDQQRSERLRELRTGAEEAMGAKQFDRALECLEQAIGLDSQSAELQTLRDAARQAKQQVEKVQDALRRAESAHCSGELDEALAAVEEALQIEPDSSEAHALRGVIAREIVTRSRQSEINVLLTEAQRQISSRRFTTAIDALKKAQALDPSAPAVKELMALAASGQEQELKRREIEKLSAEIQEHLNRDDYRGACEKADEAVTRFPHDNGLLKLHTLAERQKQAGEKRQFVEEHVSRARKLLESGQTGQALEILETACQRYPSEPALLSLVTVVRENLDQERVESRKQEFVQRAKEALRRKSYDQAVEILEAASAELNAPAEIEDLLQFVREEAATQTKRQVLDVAAQEAHRLVTAEQYEDAIAFLQGVVKEVADEELDILLADAQRQLSEFHRRVKDAVATAERLMQTERYVEAVRYLESQAATCGKSPEFQAVVERARHEQERMQAVAAAVRSARAALSAENLDNAAAAIEECKKTFGDHAELKQVAEEVASRRRDAANSVVSKAVGDARMLLLARWYQAALETLDAVEASVKLAPKNVRSRYENLRGEAERGARREKKQAKRQAELSMAATATSLPQDAETRQSWMTKVSTVGPDAPTAMGSGASDAVTEMGVGAEPTPPVAATNSAAAPASSAAAASAAADSGVVEPGPKVGEGRDQIPAGQRPVPHTAGATVPQPGETVPRMPGETGTKPTGQKPAPHLKPASKNTIWIIGAAAAALLLVLAVAGLRHRTPATPAATAPVEGYIEVVLQPWGTVKSLQGADGKVTNIGEFTPFVVSAPPGEYSLTVVGPNGEEQTDHVSVTAKQRVQYQHTFEVVDGAKIVSAY